MWTPATRRQHSRNALRYQTDLTDDEWRLIEPYLPPPNHHGRPRSWPLREIVNAIFYVMHSGCPWRLLPSDFPPWRTVYRWFHAWRGAGLFERINHGLVMADRERTGREASQTGAIIDSRHSFPFVEIVFADSAYAGKKVSAATCILIEIIKNAVIRLALPYSRGAGSLSASSPGSDEIVG